VNNLNKINSTQEEIKSRLKLGEVQNIFSLSWLPKNLNIKIYKTIILPVMMYGHETWSLTLTEECRLTMFEKRVLKRIFGPKSGKR
jgi:hypothetical protein